MKLIKGFAYAGISMLFIGIQWYLITVTTDGLSVILITLMSLTLVFVVGHLVETSFNKEMDSMKRNYINKGADDILNQMYDDPEIQEYMKQRVPLINGKGEEYGSTSLWGKIRDFKNKGYNPNKNIK